MTPMKLSLFRKNARKTPGPRQPQGAAMTRKGQR